MTTREDFFRRHALPVFGSLSPAIRQALTHFMAGGNTAFREKRLLEFFKTIDWLAPDEPVGNRILEKLSPPVKRQLQREIEDYRMQKAADRAESAEKRQEYRLRVFEYFRVKMPSADKALLESLRDYELNLTGRDVNWRHYFTLDSFKKIDAFIQAAPAERQAWFAEFRRDVDTYKKNYDKIVHARQYGSPTCDQVFTFDDWCDMMGDELPRGGARQSGHRRKADAPGMPDNAVVRAYQTLQLACNTPPDAVKKRFRRLTLQYHPDLPNGSEEVMKAIVGAYQEIQRYWRELEVASV